ncbi:MAG: DUF3467 domain-containing protein [Pseudonocardiales bacterium]|nr:MAG: DUF3467 domain-containing protein [Pseudonocardiales bacterium]
MTQPQQFVAVTVPEEQEAGVYANLLAVWHTQDEFTFDFAVKQPAQMGESEDGTPVVHVPARVVTRVRVPPGQVFEILKALNENMTHYEQAFGEIRRPS